MERSKAGPCGKVDKKKKKMGAGTMDLRRFFVDVYRREKNKKKHSAAVISYLTCGYSGNLLALDLSVLYCTLITVL